MFVEVVTIEMPEPKNKGQGNGLQFPLTLDGTVCASSSAALHSVVEVLQIKESLVSSKKLACIYSLRSLPSVHLMTQKVH